MYFVCRSISFDNFESQPPSENLTVPPMHVGPFKAREPLNAPKSREQRIQEALSILRDRRLKRGARRATREADREDFACAGPIV